MLKINKFKKLVIHFRNVIKYTSLVIIATFLAIIAIVIFYKPTYAVSLNGEMIGYTDNKSVLQMKINQYMEGKTKEDIAFAQIDAVPSYKLCLLKKDVVPNDDEIYTKVTSSGTEYYKYYAITENQEEKAYTETFKEAEDVIAGLKKKNSANKDNIGIIEKYATAKEDFTEVDKCVSKLYKEVKKDIPQKSSISLGSVSGMSFKKVDIGINLIKPIQGQVYSRYGARDRIRGYRPHGGIDIPAHSGTPIKAAANGTVVKAGYVGSYGNIIILSHGNGVETVYAHCNKISVSVGDKVTQGQMIGKVGATGRATGSHLHLEVRKDGVKYNPQYYVY